MTTKDDSKLTAWLTRVVSLRAAAKGTTKYQEALNLKAELMERAEKKAKPVDCLVKLLNRELKTQISPDTV